MSAPAFSIGPLAYALSISDFAAWVERAPVGARIVYAHGSVPPRGEPAWALAGALETAGRVTLTAARDGGVTEWIATKLAAGPGAAAAAPIEDAAAERVLARLRRAANLEQVCPTNAELAEACGLKDADAASYRIRKLIRERRIRVEDQGPRARRIVTIVATGRSTVAGGL